MKKYKKKLALGTWIKFPEDKEVECRIRPFSLFNMTKLPNDETELSIKQIWETFNYSLLDWKGIEGEDGSLDCNEENKRLVYDFDQELVMFIISESSKLREKIITLDEIKNLKTSQLGDILKTEK